MTRPQAIRRRRRPVSYTLSVGHDRSIGADELSHGTWLVLGTPTPVLDLRPIPKRRRVSLRQRLGGWWDLLLVLVLIVGVVGWGRVQGA